MMLARLSGEGGILQQITEGEWDDRLADPAQRADAVALLDVMREQVRYARAAIGGLEDWRDASDRSTPYEGWLLPSQARAMDHRLPFNRKERYFTGTVLPAIAAHDGFAQLSRLLSLCDLMVSVPPGLDGEQEIQFFTEYGFNESVFRPYDRDRFSNRPEGGDTPDLVLAGPDWILAIEAKLYDQPSTDSLNGQLTRQAKLVSYWADQFGIPEDRVRHVALLPQKLADRLGRLIAPTVTWESVLAAYRVVGPRFWLAQLEYALAQYDEYAGLVLTYGANKQGTRKGREIFDQGMPLLPGRPKDQTGLDPSVPFDFMGRSGGLDGPLIADDISSGAWESRSYEVRVGTGPNDNWFSMSDFRDKVLTAGT